MNINWPEQVPESHSYWFNEHVVPIIPDTRPYDHIGHMADLYPESLQVSLICMWLQGPTTDAVDSRLTAWHTSAARKLRDEAARDATEALSVSKRLSGVSYDDPGSYIVQECIYLCSPKHQPLIELMMLRDMDVSKAARELDRPQSTVWRMWQEAQVELHEAYVTVRSRNE